MLLEENLYFEQLFLEIKEKVASRALGLGAKCTISSYGLKVSNLTTPNHTYSNYKSEGRIYLAVSLKSKTEHKKVPLWLFHKFLMFSLSIKVIKPRLSLTVKWDNIMTCTLGRF